MIRRNCKWAWGLFWGRWERCFKTQLWWWFHSSVNLLKIEQYCILKMVNFVGCKSYLDKAVFNKMKYKKWNAKLLVRNSFRVREGSSLDDYTRFPWFYSRKIKWSNVGLLWHYRFFDLALKWGNSDSPHSCMQEVSFTIITMVLMNQSSSASNTFWG